MIKNAEIFKPALSEITKIAEGFKDIIIADINDKKGYKKAKDARKELGDIRILITKEGAKLKRKAREEHQKLLAEEKRYLKAVVPVEDDLKEMIKEIDEKRDREERKLLLPDRKKQLKEIELELSDDEILDMDTKEFSEFFKEKKMEVLEAREEERKKKEAKEAEDARVEEAKKQAVADEKARAEKEAKEKAEIAEQQRIDQEKEKEIEAKKIADEEEAEKQKLAKSTLFLDFLKKNGMKKSNKDDFHIEKTLVSGTISDETRVVLYRKVGEITIK